VYNTLNKNGEKNNQHKGQSRPLERVQETRHRSRQRLIRHVGTDDKGESEGVMSEDEKLRFEASHLIKEIKEVIDKTEARMQRYKPCD
jgi:hypothetical protein